MLMGIPFCVLMIGVTYFVLVKLIYPNGLSNNRSSEKIIEQALKALGPIKKTEKRVLVIFLITIFLWIFRVYINKWIPFIQLSDAGISMLAALSLFTIPFNFKEGVFTLLWEDTSRLAWGILILFGGGLALAKGLSTTGVIDFIGTLVAKQGGLNVWIVVSMLILIMLFMTELMSNVALVAIFAPVVAGIALGLDYEMMYLLIPVSMASSCAFMLPMATPPNAIVFASGYIKVHEMAKAGILLNIISVLVLIGFAIFVIPAIF